MDNNGLIIDSRNKISENINIELINCYYQTYQKNNQE